MFWVDEVHVQSNNQQGKLSNYLFANSIYGRMNDGVSINAAQIFRKQYIDQLHLTLRIYVFSSLAVSTYPVRQHLDKTTIDAITGTRIEEKLSAYRQWSIIRLDRLLPLQWRLRICYVECQATKPRNLATIVTYCDSACIGGFEFSPLFTYAHIFVCEFYNHQKILLHHATI